MSLYDPPHMQRQREKITLAVINELFGKTLNTAESLLQQGVPTVSYLLSPYLEIVVGVEEDTGSKKSAIICTQPDDMKMILDVVLKQKQTPEIMVRINPAFFAGNKKEDIARIIVGRGSVIIEPLPNPNRKQSSQSLDAIEWKKDTDKDVLFNLFSPVLTKAVESYITEGRYQKTARGSHMALAHMMASKGPAAGKPSIGTVAAKAAAHKSASASVTPPDLHI